MVEASGYDATGNRISLTTSAGMSTYSYPAESHHLLAVDGETRDHDAAGNTTAIGGKGFTYNDANRMSAVKQDGAVAERYGYNHRGERVLRAPEGGNAQITVYDEAGQWLGNYSATGQTQQQAIWLDNYPVALINAVGSGVPEVAYIQPDHLGTPRVVIDPVRDVAIWEWSNRSEVFGDQAPAKDPDGDGVAFELAPRFPGQQATDASGMFYNYQREYDAAVGRYSQSDPIGLQGGISAYGYVSGDPLGAIDPFGLRNVHKTAVAVGNAINAGRLFASGTLRIAGGLGLEMAVVTAGPGTASIGLGVWNITSGQKAWARAEQQWKEAACEDSSTYSRADVLKMYSGLLPWGTETDDPGEDYWIEVMERRVREAARIPGEFLQEVGTIGL